MLYLWLKLIHIISSTLLFGTGIGTASTMVYAYYSKNRQIIAAITRYVVLADWIFTATSGVLQLLTGFALVFIAGYSFTYFWIWGALLGYIIAGMCWFIVVYLQFKMRDMAHEANLTNSMLPERFHYYFKMWFILGWPAFISLLVVFYLMTIKPS